MPVLHITAVLESEKKIDPNTYLTNTHLSIFLIILLYYYIYLYYIVTFSDWKRYVCPCYKNPLRTDRNFIFNVDLRSEEDPAKWALEGVALCCTDLS